METRRKIYRSLVLGLFVLFFQCFHLLGKSIINFPKSSPQFHLIEQVENEKDSIEITGIVLDKYKETHPFDLIVLQAFQGGDWIDVQIVELDFEGAFKELIPPALEMNDLRITFSYIGNKSYILLLDNTMEKLTIILEMDNDVLDRIGLVDVYMEEKKTYKAFRAEFAISTLSTSYLSIMNIMDFRSGATYRRDGNDFILEQH